MTAVALSCGSCGFEPPEGSQYCLKCGKPLGSAAEAMPLRQSGVCSCGNALPPGAQFCPHCSETVIGAYSPWSFPLRRKKKPRSLGWVWGMLALVPLAWLSLSQNPAAQGFRRVTGLTRAETVAPGTFTVSPNNFSVYKFYLPAAARGAMVNGHFAVEGGEVEVYLLTEADAVNWQYGYAPNGFYSSGRVHEDEVSAALPDGAGSYCLIFSNKAVSNQFAASGEKTIHAMLKVSYKQWWSGL